MAGGQQQAGLVGHTAHFLAFVDAMAHDFFGQHVQARVHRRNSRLGMQMQGQGDQDPFQAVGLGVFDQLLISAVDLDVLSGLVFVFPAVLSHKSRLEFQGLVGVMIAVKSPMDAIRPNVGD